MIPSEVPDGPVLVDTDVFSWIAWKRDRYSEFETLLAGRVLALSFVSVGELRAGAIRAEWGDKRRAELEVLIRRYVVLPATDAVTHRWAAMHAHLKDQLKGGGINDMWIAACALAQNPPLPVATGNLTDFTKIADMFPLVLVHPDR